MSDSESSSELEYDDDFNEISDKEDNVEHKIAGMCEDFKIANVISSGCLNFIKSLFYFQRITLLQKIVNQIAIYNSFVTH